MTTVVVEVLGGVVQNVAANGKKTRVVVMDWDNIEDAKHEKADLGWFPLAKSGDLTPETRRLYRRLLRS